MALVLPPAACRVDMHAAVRAANAMVQEVLLSPPDVPPGSGAVFSSPSKKSRRRKVKQEPDACPPPQLSVREPLQPPRDREPAGSASPTRYTITDVPPLPSARDVECQRFLPATRAPTGLQRCAPGTGTEPASSPPIPRYTGEKWREVWTREPQLRFRNVDYEDACKARKIVPKFKRAVRDALSGEKLDLGGLGLGDAHFTALLQDRSVLPAAKVKQWCLSDSRLADEAAEALAQALPVDVQAVDLSKNELTAKGVLALADRMANLQRLCKVDLSSNGLRSECMQALAAGAAACPSLLCLQLNDNQLRDGAELGMLVAGHPQLSRLSLHNNYLRGGGAAALFGGVLRNARKGGQLADLDVAWNCIGEESARSGAKEIAAVLREKSALCHLDLSYNSMGPTCCADIAEALRNNHTLIGLHLVGNCATMDENGFVSAAAAGPGGATTPNLRRRNTDQMDLCSAGVRSIRGGAGPLCSPAPTQRLLAGAPTLRRQGRGISLPSLRRQQTSGVVGAGGQARDRDVLEHQTVCWLCEGWERLELEWPLKAGEEEPRAVWAFTSLDGFATGLRLRREDKPPRFAAARMVPPGCKLQVVYQVDGALRVPAGMCSEQLSGESCPVIRLRTCAELPGVDEATFVRVEQAGVVESLGGESAASKDLRSHSGPDGSGGRPKQFVLLDGPDPAAGPVLMPRTVEDKYVRKSKRIPFYAAFKHHKKGLAKEALLTDWPRSKVHRVVPEEQRDAVQSALQSRYDEVIAVYRAYSVLGVSGETVMGITNLDLLSLMNDAGLAGDEVTCTADVDRLFIAAKVTTVDMLKGAVVRNGKALVRHQFAEFLIRIAEQRFVRRSGMPFVEAVGNVLDALKPIYRSLTAELDAFFAAFRTEAVDEVYVKHREALQKVFQRNSGKRALPGSPAWMSLAEFEEVLDLTDAYDQRFSQRKAASAFLMGMELQVEEVYVSRFQEMTFLEFQHAVGAVVFMREGFRANRMANLLEAFFSDNLRRALDALSRRPSKRTATPDDLSSSF